MEKLLFVVLLSIASLLDGEWTGHSELKLPLNIHINPDVVCNIMKHFRMAKVNQKYEIIIWDELTITHQHSIETPDRTMKDLNDNTRLFGGASQFCFVSCEEARLPNLNDLKTELHDIAGSLPNLPINNETAVPSVEEVTNVLKKKCEKNGGAEAFPGVENARNEIEFCIKDLINVTVIQEEIQEYKKSGSLDVVFKKYCDKRPLLKQCITNFTVAIDPCLEEKEKVSKRMILNITDSLMNFICYKDGDRIAMFIAEKGIECLSDNQEAISACVNSTFAKHIPEETPTVDNLPLFLLEDENCADMGKLENCIVKELQTCPDPTPANIVQALFKYIFKVTPCGEMMKESTEKSTNFGTTVLATLSTVMSTFAMLLIL